ncbi:transcriptional regulator family: Fungal Specific TF [Aspergillus niger]|nr:transcriptional regulator family: Fungal Specific TF [Aspergillus niger]
MANGDENRQLPRLPACQSCYTKKAKCDNARPKCSPCMRSGQACLTVSLNGSEPVSREYIFELEQKVLSLQTGVIDIEPSMHDTEYHSPEDFRNLGPKSKNSSGRAVEHGNESDSDTSQSPNYTEGAGIRYTSVMLDRPPAISDKDIQIGFPADADDEELDLAGQSGVFADLDSFYRISTAQLGSTHTTETSVFLVCLRLRQVTSKIHTKFQQKGKGTGEQTMSQLDLATASGTIYLDLDELLNELDSWRISAPIFTNPKCLYERQEWYDLLLMRERLLIIRKAIDLVPKRNNVPPRDLLSICLEYSVGTISSFCAMFDQGLVTYTRSYFQTLFTAGLSVMFCVSVVEDLDVQTIKSASEAVKKGEKTLKLMVQKLPDSVHYVALYEALRADILRKTKSLQRPDAAYTEQHIHSTAINQDTDDVQYQQHGSLNTGIPGVHDSPIQHNPLWPILTPDETANEFQMHESAMENQLLSWDIFGDNVFWSMEAGMLGEYVYGSSAASQFLNDI